MNLKNYGKTEVQKDLDKLLLQVQKELKKKMFPRRHKKLLCNNVIIELGEWDDNLLGCYETIENKQYKYKFQHKITINDYVYDEYKNGLLGLGVEKKYTKRKLKNTIAHELIHAYVYENYEFCSNDYRFHNDGSPIFLSILTFLNIPSGHKTMRSFKHTEVYKKVKSYSNYEALEIYLIHLTCKYEETFRQLEQVIDNDKVYANNFEFSSGNVTGVKGITTSTIVYQNILAKANNFVLGSNVNMDNLKELVLSKINRNVFDNKYTMLSCQNIEDKRNKLKLQSMNI
jgi:hypothetical protein